MLRLLFIKKKMYAILIFIPLFIISSNYLHIIPKKDSQQEKYLSVLTLNCFHGQKIEKASHDYKSWRAYMGNLKTVPDVFCFQEYKGDPAVLVPDMDKKHFYKPSGRALNIVTNYPIVGKGEVVTETKKTIAIYVDILKLKDTIRIYNGHLHSNKISTLIQDEDHTLQSDNNSWRKIFRLVYASAKTREQQAKLLVKHTESCPFPFVLAGDMNEMANSYVYYQFYKEMNDSFKASGLGLHNTYKIGPFGIRIDYLFSSEKLTPTAHVRLPYEISDHKATQADYALAKQ